MSQSARPRPRTAPSHQLSELTVKFHKARVREQRFLAERLASLNSQQARTAQYYEDQASRLNHELHTCIKPRSLDLIRLKIPENKMADSLQEKVVGIPSWIPGIESTRQFEMTEAMVGLRIYGIVRKNTMMSGRLMENTVKPHY